MSQNVIRKQKEMPREVMLALIISRRERKRMRSRTGFNLVLRTVAALVVIAILSSGVTFALGMGAAGAAYSAMTKNLPSPEEVRAASEETFETTKIYDRTGQHLLYEVIDPNAGDRHWVSIDDLPDYLLCGTVASEDKTFWTNPGVDPLGITRAFLNNLQGLPTQGGSSITQQVVKQTVISPEERYQRSYSRKIKEILIALELTRRYDKRQILEWYLNTIFYGNLAYGIDAAARVYFGKPASELTISEAATLIAIPQSPALNPFDAPEAAEKRKEVILRRMVDEGCITSAEAEAAKAEPWHLAETTRRFNIEAPHFSMYVRRQLEEMFGPEMVAGGGLRVYTTLDLDLNNEAQCVAQT